MRTHAEIYNTTTTHVHRINIIFDEDDEDYYKNESRTIEFYARSCGNSEDSWIYLSEEYSHFYCYNHYSKLVIMFSVSFRHAGASGDTLRKLAINAIHKMINDSLNCSLDDYLQRNLGDKLSKIIYTIGETN